MSKSDNKGNSPYTVSTRKEAAIPLLYCNPQARLGLREKVREPIQAISLATLDHMGNSLYNVSLSIYATILRLYCNHKHGLICVKKSREKEGAH